MVNQREKQLPVGWGDFLFNNPGTRTWDARNFVELSYQSSAPRTRGLQWRASYDWYTYQGCYYYFNRDHALVDNRDQGRAGWFSSRLSYSWMTREFGELTVGGEFAADLFNDQWNWDKKPAYRERLRLSATEVSGGLFVKDELPLNRRWTANFGARLDRTNRGGGGVSPRLGLVYQRSASTTLKFLYGRSFRDPSAYERAYSDGATAMANPLVRPEHADTAELVYERALGKRLQLVGSGYYYQLKDMIEQVWVGLNVAQYQNEGRIRGAGAEFELSAKAWHGIDAAASVALQDNHLRPENTRLPDSPVAIAKARLAVPLGAKWVAALSMNSLSSRDTLAAAPLPSVTRLDATLTSLRLNRAFDVQVGLRNALNRKYWDPTAINSQVDRIQQDGRTFFVKLIWRHQ
jgi:iron complex outermembrane receptor protein